MTQPPIYDSPTGRFFEDFTVGEEIRHATPRTVTTGDIALYTALTGARFPLHSSDAMAMNMGFAAAPIDDLLTFHIVFGKTVPDISLNAVANLGYANGSFGAPVYPGDTLSATSTVIGAKRNANGKTGIVWVNSVGRNQRGEVALDYIRWAMVNKREATGPATLAPDLPAPDLPESVPASMLQIPDGLDMRGYDLAAAGSERLWEDYREGERIDHRDGITIVEAEHAMATRLYHNTAKVHFDRFQADRTRFGKRIVYGGHIISLARAVSINGLANAFRIAAINGGRHVAPTFAGDTIYAWSEVTQAIELPGRDDVGALRLRTVGYKNTIPGAFPDRGEDGKPHPNLVLDLDYTVLMKRR